MLLSGAASGGNACNRRNSEIIEIVSGYKYKLRSHLMAAGRQWTPQLGVYNHQPTKVAPFGCVQLGSRCIAFKTLSVLAFCSPHHHMAAFKSHNLTTSTYKTFNIAPYKHRSSRKRLVHGARDRTSPMIVVHSANIWYI